MFIDAVLEAGWNSVRRTPTLLKVLADAGVVDAGGYGLMVLLEGMARGGGSAPREDAVGTRPTARSGGPGGIRERVHVLHELPAWRVTLSTRLRSSEALIPLGDSLLVVGTESQLKVHIHTDQPGTVLTLATMRGSAPRGRDRQHEGPDRRPRGPAARTHDRHRLLGRTQVVAVVVGEGMKRLFRSMGAAYLVDGGQSMNPSAEELLRAVEATDSR